MSILLTGGTGWIGRSLLPLLRQTPLIVTRDKTRSASKMDLPIQSFVECDLANQTIPRHELSGAETVVHLMGESVAEGRWDQKKKNRIRNSRVVGTSHLVHSLLKAEQLPNVVVAASAIGLYGDHGDVSIDESFGLGKDFLSHVCVEWEGQMKPLIERGVRVCFLRIGIVLGQGGGALEKMVPPFKFAVGGKLGSGKQWMSWIHMQDLLNQILFLIENEHLSGAFNGTAPNPVRNIEFTKALGKALGRPSLMTVPAFALKIALGEFADFLLASQRVIPHAFGEAGFEFAFPKIDTALAQILGK